MGKEHGLGPLQVGVAGKDIKGVQVLLGLPHQDPPERKEKGQELVYGPRR